MPDNLLCPNCEIPMEDLGDRWSCWMCHLEAEKEENDYSALTVWAVYDDPHTKHRKILLVDAWKKRLELHGEDFDLEQVRIHNGKVLK